MNRLRPSLALCACALLALPAAAGARPGHRSFNATFPVASSLCAKVAAGHAPQRLAGSVAQVTAACSALNASFTKAQADYATTVTPLTQQASAAVAARRAACHTTPHDAAACKAARVQARAQLRSLRAQIRSAGRAYHATVEAARKTFWSTIHALRGGATLPADRTVGPGPVTAVPSSIS
jgi:hypothetical protein